MTSAPNENYVRIILCSMIVLACAVVTLEKFILNTRDAHGVSSLQQSTHWHTCDNAFGCYLSSLIG